MQIEAGKYYRTRNGRKVGPMLPFGASGFHYDTDKMDETDERKLAWWLHDGTRFGGDEPDSLDIVAEWADEPGTPKLWCDMTPEEKGALLLAWHDGKEIEYMWPGGGWRGFESLGCQSLHPSAAYRVKPEPARETVKVIIWNEDGDTELGTGTIDLIDGEPNYASIKMDAI